MPPIDPDRVIANVGRRVGELRSALGWTQQEMADRAEITIKYVQRVEAGEENLTLRSLVRFANLLGVSVNDLFSRPRSARPSRGRPPQQS